MHHTAIAPYPAPPSRLGQARRIIWQLSLSLLLGLALSLSLWLIQPTQAQGSIIHVTSTGDPTQTGNSWATATSLTQALTIATAGDEIWVASGVYTPGTTISDTFNLVPGVALYGGFAATEAVRTERDWVANLTILSGDIGGDDTDPDGNGVLTTTTHIVGSNSNHVVLADGIQGSPITETTVLDGFTITAGQAKKSSYLGGGGLYCAGNGSGNECSPSLSNLSFAGNSARIGGAMYNDGSYSGNSSPSLVNVTFSGNSAYSSGGAMYNFGPSSGNSSPSLVNVTFSGNSADVSGGAMVNFGNSGNSSPVLNNVTFSGNSAGDDGGAMVNEGSFSGDSSPVLNNVTFSGNSARNRGGAMLNEGYGSGNSSPVLNNVTFADNSASSGGAMYNIIGSPILSNVTFSGNSAGYSGGAMFNLGWFIFSSTSSPTLNTVTFAGNSAGDDGGAMLNKGYGSGNSSPVLNTVTFADNSASSGGAMFNAYNSPSLSDVTFAGNSADNNGGAMLNDGSSPRLSDIIFSGNSAGDDGGAMYNLGNRFFGDSSPILSNVTFSGNSARNGGAMYNEAGEMHDDVILSSASSPVLNNVTFAGNSARFGGAMLNDGRFGSSSPVLHNAILWGNIATNRGHQLYNLDAIPVLSYTLIQSGTNHITGTGSFTVTYGPGILTSDPLFVDADGPDNITGTLDDNLRLSRLSPAIDAGDNSAISLLTDLAGNPRFYDDTGVVDTGYGTAPFVDIGAYERQSSSFQEIAVIGNGVEIADGSTNPSLANHTDFGRIAVSGGAMPRTFTIVNSGEADLLLTGSPPVSLTTGIHFSVTQQPTSLVSSLSTTTFQINFNPLAVGRFTDVVSIVSNDGDENPYLFVISGTGVEAIYLPLLVRDIQE